MKAIKLLLAATFLASVTTLAFAGPGTDHWLSRQKQKKERAAAKATPQVQVCTTPCGCGEIKQ